MGDAARELADGLEPLRLRQADLQLALRRHVPLHRDVARDPARVVTHRADGRMLEDPASVPGAVHDLAAPRVAAGEAPPHGLVEGGVVVPALEDPGVAAQDLVAGVARHALEGRVDVGDPPVRVGHHHRLRRLLDRAREAGEAGRRIVQVGHVQHERRDLLALAGHPRAHHEDRHAGPVRPRVLLLEGRAGAKLPELGDRTVVEGEGLRRGHPAPVDLTALHLGPRPAGEGEPVVVRLQDPPADLRDDDAEDVGIEEAVHALGGDPEGLLGVLALRDVGDDGEHAEAQAVALVDPPAAVRQPHPGAIGTAGAVLDVPGILGGVPRLEAARQVVGVDDLLPVVVCRQRLGRIAEDVDDLVAQHGRAAAALLDGDDRVHAVDHPAQALLARPEGILRGPLGRHVHHDPQGEDPGLAVRQAPAAVQDPDPRPIRPAHAVGQLPGARRGEPCRLAGCQVVGVDQGGPRLVRLQVLGCVAQDGLGLGAVDDRCARVILVAEDRVHALDRAPQPLVALPQGGHRPALLGDVPPDVDEAAQERIHRDVDQPGAGGGAELPRAPVRLPRPDDVRVDAEHQGRDVGPVPDEPGAPDRLERPVVEPAAPGGRVDEADLDVHERPVRIEDGVAEGHRIRGGVQRGADGRPGVVHGSPLACPGLRAVRRGARLRGARCR